MLNRTYRGLHGPDLGSARPHSRTLGMFSLLKCKCRWLWGHTELRWGSWEWILLISFLKDHYVDMCEVPELGLKNSITSQGLSKKLILYLKMKFACGPRSSLVFNKQDSTQKRMEWMKEAEERSWKVSSTEMRIANRLDAITECCVHTLNHCPQSISGCGETFMQNGIKK